MSQICTTTKSIVHECPDCSAHCTCEFGFNEPIQCMHCIVTTDEFRSLHAEIARTKDEPDDFGK